MAANFSQDDQIEFERTKRTKLAYLYHSADEFYFDSFYYKHLEVLRRDKISDEQPGIPGGENPREYLEHQFEGADAIILFLSYNFEADKFYKSPEVITLLEACYKKGKPIWLIIAKPYHWQPSIFQKYGTLLEKDKAITLAPDEVLTQIVAKIDSEVKLMLSEEWANEGHTYYHNMLFREASAAYNNSLYYIPNYPPAIFGKWRTTHKMNKPEEAKQFLEKLLAPAFTAQPKGKGSLSTSSQPIKLLHACYRAKTLLELGKISDAQLALQEVFQQIATPVEDLQITNILRRTYAEACCGEGDINLKLGDRTTTNSYYEQALVAYRKARKLDPKNPTYLDKIGRTYIAQADRLQANELYEKAQEIYEETISSYPAYAPGYVGQGNIFYHTSRFQEALDAYEHALQLDPYEIEAYYGKGRALLATRKPQEALAAFEDALRLEGNNASHWYIKGRALAILERYNEAIEAYKMACDYGLPQSVKFLVHYATALLELADIEYSYAQQELGIQHCTDALHTYQRAQGQRGNEGDVNYGIGRIQFMQKNWHAALVFYQRAISLEPHKAEVSLAIGKVLIELGDDGNAFAYFEFARSYCHLPESTVDEADIEAAYGDAYYSIANRPYLNKNDEALIKARDSYKKALCLREHTWAYVGLGKTYMELHRYKDAISAFGQALALKPQLAKCYSFKGICHYKIGQPAEACEMYEAAINAGFNNASLQKNLGEALLAMKNYRDAEKAFDFAIEHMDKEDEEAYCGKALALYGQENIPDTLLYFEKACEIDRFICLKPLYRDVLGHIYFLLEKLLQSGPQAVAMYRYKGKVLIFLRERFAEARDAFNIAIAYGDSYAATYCCRGIAYEMLGEFSQALNDYNEALRIDPTHHWAQEGKARVENMVVPSHNGFFKSFFTRLKFLL